MTALTWVLLAFAVIGLLFGLWQWTARRRTVQRLDNMLEQSISSGFTEEHFDETELSALETKFARFLRGSAHTQKTMKTEQEAVKTLISDISHQTRTPIANLLVYASLLTESDLSPRQREQVQALLTQGEKLSFLIQTLVKASRLETGIVVPTPTLGPVAPLLEATVEQERPAAEKKKITLQNLPFVGDASFDPRWTSEALGNVVNNAVKYTPAGGRVTVSAQMLETFCRVDVTDTGPGIPEEEQGGIFNRFYRGTLTHSAEGLGLGLYLAREILSLQGGYIKVSSKPGNGSTFSLYLPRAILETKNLKKYYGKGDTQVKALDGVNLSVEDGEFVAIVGTSGSGKSTLLHMLGGLDRPTSGSVTVDGKNIFSLKDEALTIFRRRKIGFVFQSFNLVPVLTVRENIVLPIQLDGGKVDERYVGEVVTALGLEKKLNSLPGQLSGGQQQRVAIARALATKPAILLADEPTGNLDSRTSQDVLSLMKVTGRKFSQTMVMITHNEEIAQLSDRIVRIEDGRIVTQ